MLKDKKLTRRQFIMNTAIPAMAAVGYPSIIKAENRKPTLRVIGTHVTLKEPLRQRAEKELGFNIEFYPGGSAEVLLKASTNPESFDLYEQWSNSIKVLWQSKAIKGIDLEKLTHWHEINNLTKTGSIVPGAKIGRGDAPHKLLYVQPDDSIGQKPSSHISFMPYVHNTDSFGYNTDFIPKGEAYTTESWASLLNDDYAGKVAIVNDPTIGIFDLALAVEARKLMKFNDIGNMTTAEVDQLFDIIIDFKKRGHFRGMWTSVPQSVDLMKRKEVIIQSMFSPAVSTLNGQGIPCRYAAPKEGYRAWQGVMCLSSQVNSEREDAAYQYMNWWLSGWPGAFIARQGYYISNPQKSRQFMTPDEWDYWYAGKAANQPLLGTDGRISVLAGQVRSGGAYETRFSNIAVWNSVMDTYDYSLSKWKEFVWS